MFNHVDTSSPFGVLEYRLVDQVQYLNISALGLLAQSISFSTDFTIQVIICIVHQPSLLFQIRFEFFFF